ncbi:unnamed protein product [Paramecium sonneborni]|uniref:G domain-containing protein n=1 Tax=Paramecium sonneborni TaxID=65129 RepID=A0A8S1P8C5_9CILI|nr:unnamed protein product [Paramecium sonneborni]
MSKIIENEYYCIQEHKLPIIAVLQDPKLSIRERLVCSQCMENLETDTQTVGWKKVKEQIQSQIQQKQQINNRFKNHLLLQLKQLQTQIEELGNTINNEIQNLLKIIDQWKQQSQVEFREQSSQFWDELDQYFKNQQQNFNLENQQLQEWKKLNSIQIQTVQSKLKYFKEFEVHKICQNILTEIELNFQFVQLKPKLSLPLIKIDQKKTGDPQYKYYQQKMPNQKYKNIIFIGEKEVGKTTLINAFVNYYFGITWEDNFRLIVADQLSTEEILHYYVEPHNQRDYGIHFIDTPGIYGKNDYQTIQKISQFIYENILQIDIIMICIKATRTRLTTETQQILQSIVKILNQEYAKKIIVARTFYSGADDADKSIITDQQSPFFQISQYLSQNWHFEFNGQSIVKKTSYNSAKVYFDSSIKNFQQIEKEQLFTNDSKNEPLKVPNQLYNSQLQRPVVTDLQKPSNPVQEEDYAKIIEDSYNQLKQLLIQTFNVYYYTKYPVKYNQYNQYNQLYKVVNQVTTFQINCKQCSITCYVGFKSENNAKDFFNNFLNQQCYCGCNFNNNLIINQQLWTYQKGQAQTNNDLNRIYNSTQAIFHFLFDLYKLKTQNYKINVMQFFDVLKSEDNTINQGEMQINLTNTQINNSNQFQITKK